MPSRRTNNFPESGRSLGHVTPTILGSTVGYPSDSLASCKHAVLYNSIIQDCVFYVRCSVVIKFAKSCCRRSDNPTAQYMYLPSCPKGHAAAQFKETYTHWNVMQCGTAKRNN